MNKLLLKGIFCGLSFFGAAWIGNALSTKIDTNDLLKPSEIGSVWDTSKKESFPIEDLLNQKFHFLGKGHQAYVFVSEDSQYVLKLFKYFYPKIETPFFSFRGTDIPFFKTLYKLSSQKQSHEQKKNDFTSYINASARFKNESLLEYLHLTNTDHLKKTMTLFDNKKNAITLDADTTCFLIQKRADPIESTIKNLLQENRKEEATLVLQKLLDLIKYRESLGFYRATTKFRENFGCINLEPVQIDIGNLLFREDIGSDPSSLDPNKEKAIMKLNLWIKESFPELLEFVDVRKTLESGKDL